MAAADATRIGESCLCQPSNTKLQSNEGEATPGLPDLRPLSGILIKEQTAQIEKTERLIFDYMSYVKQLYKFSKGQQGVFTVI